MSAITQTVTIHMIDGRKLDSTSPVIEGITMDTVLEGSKTLLNALGYTGLFYQLDVTRTNGDFSLAPVTQDGRWLHELADDACDDALYEARADWAYGSRKEVAA